MLRIYGHKIMINDMNFLKRVDIKFEGKEAWFSRIVFSSGANLLVRTSSISLVETRSEEILQITGIAKDNILPALRSLVDTNVNNFRLSNLDLSPCLVYSSNNLADAIIDSSVKFGTPPTFFSRRAVIADEYWFRMNNFSLTTSLWKKCSPDMIDGEYKDPKDRQERLPQLNVRQVVSTYRTLRKISETSGDFERANDFYYGEMELRRLSGSTGLFERILIYAYWLGSGYGLRAWRALLGLIIVIMTGAAFAFRFEFSSSQSNFLDALVFALRSVVPGLRPQGEFSLVAQFLEVGLSILGPVFFALAALAIRARIRR